MEDKPVSCLVRGTRGTLVEKLRDKIAIEMSILDPNGKAKDLDLLHAKLLAVVAAAERVDAQFKYHGASLGRLRKALAELNKLVSNQDTK